MRQYIIFFTIIYILFSPVSAYTNFTLNGLLQTPTIFDIDKDPSNGLEIAIGGFSPKENPDDSYLFLIYNNGTPLSGWPTADYASTTSPQRTAGVVFSKPGIADLSGGQRLDVVMPMEELVISAVTTYNGIIKTYTGDGTRWWHHWNSWMGKPSYSSPVIADLDSDSDDEVLVGRDDGILYCYNHNGVALHGVDDSAPWGEIDTWVPEPVPKWNILIGNAGDTVTTAAVGDVDGDNQEEIVACSSGGYCRILEVDMIANEGNYSDPTPTWVWSSRTMTFGSGGLSSPALADISPSPGLEIMITSPDGMVYAWASNGTPLAGWPATAEPSTYPSPAVGDLDFDGDLEVVVATDNNKIYVFEHNGSRRSGFPVIITEQGTEPRSSPILADINGDDYLEIIFGMGKHEDAETNFGKVYIWDRNGNLVADPAISATDWFVGTPAVADIDNDGNNELVAGAWDENLYIWEGSGRSTRNIGWPSFHFDERNTRCYLCGNENPTATITSPSDGHSVNEGGGVSFKGSGVDTDGNVTSYKWISNIDGSLSNNQNDTISYLSVDTHTIELVVTDNKYGSGRDSITVTVNNLPPTATIRNPSGGSSFSEGTAISFNSTASDALGGIKNYSWSSIPDGILSSDQNFSISSLSVGAHTMTITVYDDDNRSNSRATDSISIYVNNVLPTSNITAPADSSTFSEGVPITFSGTGSDVLGSITNYSWSSSQDGYLATGQGFSSSTLSVGTHTISLTVTDDENTTGVESITVTIENTPPSPGINSPADWSFFSEGTQISFYGTASDSLGTIAGYGWSSSRYGPFSADKSVNFSGLNVGTHTITFTATDNFGASNSTSITIVIDNVAPTATIAAPSDGSTYAEGTSIQFSGSGSDVKGVIGRYIWTSNLDGTLRTKSNPAPPSSDGFSTSDLSVGVHTIRLSVMDDENTYGNDSIMVNVLDVAPTANITSPRNGSSFADGESINFSGTGVDATGSIVRYEWESDWDGSLSNQSNFSISNLYSNDYRHRIILTVTDDEGTNGTATIWITVNKTQVGTTTPGGGGGGAPAPAAKEGETTKTVGKILPGVAGKVVFSDTETPYISEISLKTSIVSYDVNVVVKTLETLPQTVKAPAGGVVYGQMEITQSGVQTSSLEEATISFKVPVKWMREKNVNQKEVTLQRYFQGVWQLLETTLSAEDSFYVYYKAKTPGFSYFTIVAQEGTGFEVGEPVEEIQVPVHPPITMLPNGTYVLEEDVLETPGPVVEVPKATLGPQEDTGDGNLPIAILGSVLISVVVILYLLARSRL